MPFIFSSIFLTTFEPSHNKTNKMICAPSEDFRSAWASAQPDQSSQCAQWVAEDPMFLHAESEYSDRTGRMPRLIWVSAGCSLFYLFIFFCHSAAHFLLHYMNDILFKITLRFSINSSFLNSQLHNQLPMIKSKETITEIWDRFSQINQLHSITKESFSEINTNLAIHRFMKDMTSTSHNWARFPN